MKEAWTLEGILAIKVHVPNLFWGCQGRRTGGGDDKSIQFINIGRLGDKSFKEWRRIIRGGGRGVEGWVTTLF